jgi:hypothetical protein
MRTCTVLVFAFLATPALARDSGRWTQEPPEVRAWFEGLMQPDSPPGLPISCCAEADGYQADRIRVEHGEVYATVTNSMGNPIPAGTEVLVPQNKFNKEENLTGHNILFMAGSAKNPIVYCFVSSTGT